MMKICVFVLGDGRAVHLQRIIPGLSERGLKIHVVSAKPGAVRGATAETFQVPPRNLANPRGWRVRWRKHLAGFMRRFDVVHVHFLHDWGFTPEIMESGCFVATPWGSDIVAPPGEGEPPAELVAARVAMLRHASAVTTWGPWFASAVGEYAGIDVERIELLPLGVDPKLFHPAARANANGGPEFHVGFFKGFREVYGATYLIEAVPLVLEDLPQTRFHLVGDGPQLDDCRALAQRLGVDAAIEWIPRQPHSRIPKLLAGWDLTVITSLRESFGAAALESAAMRVPVVATRVGGLPETVREGETGLLVPPEDPRAVADALVKLLNDHALRRRMGDAGRSLVEREYEWQGILDKWVKTYETAAGRVAAVA